MERFEKINDGSFYVYFVVVFSVLFFGLWLVLKTMPIAVPEKVPALSPLPPNDLVQIQPQAQVILVFKNLPSISSVAKRKKIEREWVEQKQHIYIPTPSAEYKFFYQSIKEKLTETRKPAEILSYVNNLKAVSVRLYLEYYRPSDPKVRELRAAVRKAVLRVFQEYDFCYYPNRRTQVV